MLISRFWYVILAVIAGACLYFVYLAVGQYNRRNDLSMREGLASDSQTVEWALKVDARRRLDQLQAASIDKAIQESLTSANGNREKIPQKARDDAKRALAAVNDKIPAEYKNDVLFAVDREGRVVAQVGFDAVANNDDFELGGYPAVFDGLHGWLRDDTWVWDQKMFLVFVRPVEVTVTDRPAGAVVGMKEVNKGFTDYIAKRTRTNLVFFASGNRLAAAAGVDGFESGNFDNLGTDLTRISEDKNFESGPGRSDVRLLGESGAMYARLPGDAWEQRAGFAVMRTRVAITSPLGFVSGADDKDKANVPWILILAVVLLGAAIGIGLTIPEHTLPLNQFVDQAARLRAGAQDGLQAPKLRGAYRAIAQDINAGIERVVEKGGGAARKPADLESILGPVPAQPAMSAFSFPMDGNAPPPPMQPGLTPLPGPPPGAPPGYRNQGPSPFAATEPGSRPGVPRQPPPMQTPHMLPPQYGMPQNTPPMNAPMNAPVNAPVNAMGGPTTPEPFAPPRNSPANAMSPQIQPMPTPPPFRPPPPPMAARTIEGMPPPPSAIAAAADSRPGVAGLASGGVPGYVPSAPRGDDEEGEEATMVAQVPPDVLAQASGEHKATDEAGEWLTVYEDFIRTKKQCGEATDGLTFEKFQHTLKKNRDALIQRHGCKRVRFSVYVKEGRASLKATPVKE